MVGNRSSMRQQRYEAYAKNCMIDFASFANSYKVQGGIVENCCEGGLGIGKGPYQRKEE